MNHRIAISVFLLSALVIAVIVFAPPLVVFLTSR